MLVIVTLKNKARNRQRSLQALCKALLPPLWNCFHSSVALLFFYCKVQFFACSNLPWRGQVLFPSCCSQACAGDKGTFQCVKKKPLKTDLSMVKHSTHQKPFQRTERAIRKSSSMNSANRRGKSGSSDRFYFLGLQNLCGWWLRQQN